MQQEFQEKENITSNLNPTGKQGLVKTQVDQRLTDMT